MKRIVLFLLSIVLILTCGCTVTVNGREVQSLSWTPGGAMNEKSDVKEETVDTQTQLAVKNTVGEIDIKPWDKDTIRITAKKQLKASGDQKKIDTLFEQMKLEVQKNSDRIDVNVKYIPNLFMSYHQKVDLEVMVPNRIKSIEGNITSGNIDFADIKGLETLVLYTTSGNIKVSDTEAKSFQFNLTSGNIAVESLSGSGEVKATSGNIILENIFGDVRYTATSGDLNINGLEGRLEAEMTSGRISVRDAYLKSSTRLKTTSGEIKIDAKKIDTEGEYRLNAFSGNIKLYLPKDAGFNLNADANSGNIDNDFNLSGNFGSNGHGRHELRGSVGNGGPDINISVTSGNIGVYCR